MIDLKIKLVWCNFCLWHSTSSQKTKQSSHLQNWFYLLVTCKFSYFWHEILHYQTKTEFIMNKDIAWEYWGIEMFSYMKLNYQVIQSVDCEKKFSWSAFKPSRVILGNMTCRTCCYNYPTQDMPKSKAGHVNQQHSWVYSLWIWWRQQKKHNTII